MSMTWPGKANNICPGSNEKMAHTFTVTRPDGMLRMATHLVIYVKDGQVQFVLSDFQGEMRCLVVSANEDAMPPIKGEPWVKSIDFPEADHQRVVIEPVTVEFNLEKIQKIMAVEETSRHELLKLLG